MSTNPQTAVDRWNTRYPIGTPVTAYPGARPENAPTAERLTTRTRSEADVLGGHTAVVWVDGHSACIALTHVDPLQSADTYTPPAKYVRSDRVDCCPHGRPVGPGSCEACWDLVKWDAVDAPADADPEPAAGCVVSAAPTQADDRAGLRERIAETLYAHDHPGWRVPLRESDVEPVYRERGAAVMAVLPPPTDRGAVLREAADRYEKILARANTGQDPRYWTAVRDITLGLRRVADEAQQQKTEHVCKPGASTYFCPTSGQTESDCHGGFTTCCDRPDLHQADAEAQQAASKPVASPSNRRALVHNAITDALSAAGDWVPLSIRIAATRAALAEVDAWHADDPAAAVEAQQPDTETPDDLAARLEAVLTERFTELGNQFAEMRVHEQGPDGWPSSRLVSPHMVAEALRELLGAGSGPRAADNKHNEGASRVVRCSRAILSRPHDAHDWEPLPGMDPAHCPGHTFAEEAAS